ncbi:FtsK/SpoIIIE domain-containing protein [Helcobacillus massiliensis]|uniref:FtsK/SpoIIIE domain-containing protein n=1 Tax=Helcobacillus massiliensis TaxID=521392 RepID=UPI0021A366C1|nr:FtsK/SpoIIIE domain-containing protein [Helcobacillus massiliensis]MCT1557533.1 FtsK/SpoIIIE domain-containing protein [Helcobacillus massiliensis]MCT2037400.1 FtsK/SpoIIIE domain-containing protein [Helcobacillus massiliensis]MCT2331972.1 FtsK/SpoIIIE domain-containing protein [Helcobacillus massiliensis]
MRLRLTLETDADTTALAVTADGTATVGDLADALDTWAENAGSTAAAIPAEGPRPNADAADGSGPLTISVGGQRINPQLRLLHSGIFSGTTVRLRAAGADPASSSRPTLERSGPHAAPAAYLSALTGPAEGLHLPLTTGEHTIGTSSRTGILSLGDTTLDEVHAHLSISADGDRIRAATESSLVRINGRAITDAPILHGDIIHIGQTTLRLRRTPSTSGDATDAAAIPVDPAPALLEPVTGEGHTLPKPPGRPTRQTFPIMMLIMPLFLGAGLFALTRSPFSLMFILFMPAFATAGYVNSRRNHRLQRGDAWHDFDSDIDALRATLDLDHARERELLAAHHPHIRDLGDEVGRLGPAVFGRRRVDATFGTVRIGTGSRTSATTVASGGADEPELRRQLARAADGLADITDAPITIPLTGRTPAALIGEGTHTASVLASALLQLAALHSPADLTLTAIAAVDDDIPDWLHHLPHTSSPFSPLRTTHIARGSAAARDLIAVLLTELHTRLQAPDAEAGADATVPFPRIVVALVEPALVSRTDLSALLDGGPAAGIHVIWIARSSGEVPAACRTRAHIAADSARVDHEEAGEPGSTGSITRSRAHVLDTLSDSAQRRLARHLAPLADASASTPDSTTMPHSWSLLEVDGGSLRTFLRRAAENWSRRSGTLTAVLGHTGTAPCTVDLRADGPHALVGGTTGSGKSEFLQSWVLSMAAHASPERITFLFVDYKGGSAFADCVHLPHCVGLVTDLTDHLVDRALASLRAEVRRREEILHQKGAKDLRTLEDRQDPECPPSLVIVIDEFAALAADVPHFIDGVVDIAARGRSLGLHLILATQRPSGIITGSLRTNTPLRIALRQTDATDSADIVGVRDAVDFPADRPGRAVISRGPGQLTHLQGAFVGGRTTEQQRSRITIRPVAEPSGAAREAATVSAGSTGQLTPSSSNGGAEGQPTDSQRIVTGLQRLADATGCPAPRRPWLDDLPESISLDRLSERRGTAAGAFALLDFPHRQLQTVMSVTPGQDTAITIVGAPGSGRTSALLTLAHTTAEAARRTSRPLTIWGIDGPSGGLAALHDLPETADVIALADLPRMNRLMARFADLTAAPQVPTDTLILIDAGGLRDALASAGHTHWQDTLLALLRDARRLRLTLAVTAEHPQALPAAIARSAQHRIVLRLSTDDDYRIVGERPGVLTADSPAGRALINGTEAQIAQPPAPDLGTTTTEPATGASGQRPSGIPTLPESVGLDDLPLTEKQLRVGLRADSVEPLVAVPSATMLIAGAQGSGRTTALIAHCSEFRRMHPSAPIVLAHAERAPLHPQLRDLADEVAIGLADLLALTGDLADHLAAAPGEEPCADGAAEPDVRGLIAVTGLRDLAHEDEHHHIADVLRTATGYGFHLVGDLDTTAAAPSRQLTRVFTADGTGLLLETADPSGSTLFGSHRLRYPDAPGPGRGYHFSPRGPVPVLAATATIVREETP